MVGSDNLNLVLAHSLKPSENEKTAQRDANTAHALAVVRFGHRLPTRCHNPQTGLITIHCAAAS